jgi:hypothetical protein
MNDHVRWRRLLEQLCESVSECGGAEGGRCADRNDVWTASGPTFFLGSLLHRGGPRFARRDVADLSPEKPIEQRIRGRLFRPRAVDNKNRAEPQLCGRGRGHARVVGLHPAGRDERDKKAGTAAERGPETRQLLDRCRLRCERNGRERGQRTEHAATILELPSPLYLPQSAA